MILKLKRVKWVRGRDGGVRRRRRGAPDELTRIPIFGGYLLILAIIACFWRCSERLGIMTGRGDERQLAD